MMALALALYKIGDELRYRRKTKREIKYTLDKIKSVKERVYHLTTPEKATILRHLSILENELTFYRKEKSYRKEYSDIKTLEEVLKLVEKGASEEGVQNLVRTLVEGYMIRSGVPLQEYLTSEQYTQRYGKLSVRLEDVLTPEVLDEKYRTKFESLCTKLDHIRWVYIPKSGEIKFSPKVKSKEHRGRKIVRVKDGGLRFVVEYKDKVSGKDLIPENDKDYVVKFIVCRKVPKDVVRKVRYASLPNQSTILLSDKIYFNLGDNVARLYHRLLVDSKRTITLEDILDAIPYVNREGLIRARMRIMKRRVEYVHTKNVEVWGYERLPDQERVEEF